MIPVPSGVKVWLATGHTDMRKGFDGLALVVQETQKRDPHCGHLFVFRRRRGRHQGNLARRPGHVPVLEALGEGPLRLAADGRWCGVDRRRTAGLSARRHRLADVAAHMATHGGGNSTKAIPKAPGF